MNEYAKYIGKKVRKEFEDGIYNGEVLSCPLG